MDKFVFLPDNRFMRTAIQNAKTAAENGDVPIGAVVVLNGKLIAEGYNRREADKSAVSHAEIIAIEKACKALGTRRLSGCEIYVTLEPCPMCAGAIINAGIEKIIFGAFEEKTGACGSAVKLLGAPPFEKYEVWCGILEEECAALLKDFFRDKR